MDEFKELAKKVDKLESQVDEIKDTLDEHSLTDVRLEEQLKGIKTEFLNIKQDVITTLNDHSQKTWKLIDKGIKIICILVGIICTMAGVKLLPEVLKILTGGML